MVELWRGRYHPGENAVRSFVGDMSSGWSHWVLAPMTDGHALDRHAVFVLDGQDVPVPELGEAEEETVVTPPAPPVAVEWVA